MNSDLLQLHTVMDDAGRQTVYSWPMDVMERFCATSRAVMPPDASRCAPDAGNPEPCEIGYRVPPECPHPEWDMGADGDTVTVRCRACGLIGIDVTDKWGEMLGRATPSPTPDADTGNPVMLG
jgi:hypothetical protein